MLQLQSTLKPCGQMALVRPRGPTYLRHCSIWSQLWRTNCLFLGGSWRHGPKMNFRLGQSPWELSRYWPLLASFGLGRSLPFQLVFSLPLTFSFARENCFASVDLTLSSFREVPQCNFWKQSPLLVSCIRNGSLFGIIPPWWLWGSFVLTKNPRIFWFQVPLHASAPCGTEQWLSFYFRISTSSHTPFVVVALQVPFGQEFPLTSCWCVADGRINALPVYTWTKLCSNLLRYLFLPPPRPASAGLLSSFHPALP